MTINYNATDRKPLVKAVSEFLGTKAVYMKTPTCAYRIGNVTVTREGNLRIDDPIDSEQVEKLVAVLDGQGFTADNCQPHAADTAPTGLCVSMPRRLFTDSALANLKALVAAKGGLFKKALGVNELPVEVTDDNVSFPWLDSDRSPEEINVCGRFIAKLCEMARSQKRVTVKEHDTDNEKYAFRCFLLRLGYIGEEYKPDRKLLLRNLSGSSAFKSGHVTEVADDAISE